MNKEEAHKVLAEYVAEAKLVFNIKEEKSATICEKSIQCSFCDDDYLEKTRGGVRNPCEACTLTAPLHAYEVSELILF